MLLVGGKSDTFTVATLISYIISKCNNTSSLRDVNVCTTSYKSHLKFDIKQAYRVFFGLSNL